MEIEMLINKRNLWVLSVILILLSPVSCNKDKTKNIYDNYILQVTAFIDGRDRLHITQDGFIWEHLEYSAVGLWQGKNEPTIFSFYMNNESQVNRHTWFPEWISESKYIKKGSLTYVHEVEGIKLPQHGFYIELEKLAGDGPVKIIQAPLRENNYETIIDFYDSGGGAEFYTINIIFHAKPPYNGKFIEEQYSKIVRPPKESNSLPVSKIENTDKIVFLKQEDNTWLSEQVTSKGRKGNSIGQFKIEGLDIGVGIPGQEIKTTNISRILGVEKAEELKRLNEVSVGNKQIKISKSDNGFALLRAKKEIAKIYW